MFFKRLSRGSRANSYAEDEYDSRPRSQDKYAQREHHEQQHDHHHHHHEHQNPQQSYERFDDSPHQSALQHNQGPPSPTKETSKDMYTAHTRTSQLPQEPYAQPRGLVPVSNGQSSRQNSAAFEAAPLAKEPHAAPDMLTRAFHEAVRPYASKIEHLETQLADMQSWVEQLEQQRNDLYAWIDKRGLRPDVPSSIAKVMDAQPESAAALNAQLDRKITIVNFDLHRLQDDLNDSISSLHFAAAMSKFLPDISRLSLLSGGSRFAFDLILKLGGNLNSHGGLDPSADNAEANADLTARKDFYAKLDKSMVQVVKRRFEEGEEWPVQREVKRIEKTAAYLRNFGIEPYFPSTLDAMRREVEYRNAAPTTTTAPASGSPPKY